MATNVRISGWAKRLGAQIIRIEDVAQPPAGTMIYRIKDIFTTRDGSWEPSSKRGSIEQWARDAYLKAYSAPDYFDDAGADHHIFGRVLGDNNAIIRYWTYGDNGNESRQRVKSKSGWANIVMYGSSSFVPERGERGPWAWAPATAPGLTDIVTGAGMPAKEHVSWFAVWEMVRYEGGDKPVDPVDPPSDLAQQVAQNTADIATITKWIESFRRANEGEL